MPSVPRPDGVHCRLGRHLRRGRQRPNHPQQQTPPACSFSATRSLPVRAGLLSGVVRRKRGTHGWRTAGLDWIRLALFRGDPVCRGLDGFRVAVTPRPEPVPRPRRPAHGPVPVAPPPPADPGSLGPGSTAVPPGVERDRDRGGARGRAARQLGGLCGRTRVGRCPARPVLRRGGSRGGIRPATIPAGAPGTAALVPSDHPRPRRHSMVAVLRSRAGRDSPGRGRGSREGGGGGVLAAAVHGRRFCHRGGDLQDAGQPPPRGGPGARRAIRRLYFGGQGACGICRSFRS